MKVFYVAILFVLYLMSYTLADESRIFMDAYINDQPVKLGLDTGAEGPVLFRQSAKRLNLSIIEPPDDTTKVPGKVQMALTEQCTFRLTEDLVNDSFRFAVVDMPQYLKIDFDGVLGWGAVKHMMIALDSSDHGVRIRDNMDFEKSEWKCFNIRTDLNVLVVKTSSEDTSQDHLLIDTGAPDGITITKQLWQQLVSDQTDRNTTLSAIYMPGLGLVLNKEKWIQKIEFGELPFQYIPVKMGMQADTYLTREGVDGILGMWGLSCYDWIIDGPSGKVYLKKNDLIRIPQMYEYNRLGAVFVPDNPQTDEELIAHVIKDSPAYRAGIRDGDELIRIGQLDATKWRTDPDVMPLSRFWEKPAGTKVDLTLMRNEQEIQFTVTLEEIFK